MTYTLIRFDKTSQSFANQIAIQETDGETLIGIYDFDGETITGPGGPNASFEALIELEADEFWAAVEEVSQASLVELLVELAGGKNEVAQYEENTLQFSGREFLPRFSIAVLDREELTDEQLAQHWAFVYSQFVQSREEAKV